MSRMKSWGLFFGKRKTFSSYYLCSRGHKVVFFLIMVIIEGVRYLLEPCIV